MLHRGPDESGAAFVFAGLILHFQRGDRREGRRFVIEITIRVRLRGGRVEITKGVERVGELATAADSRG